MPNVWLHYFTLNDIELEFDSRLLILVEIFWKEKINKNLNLLIFIPWYYGEQESCMWLDASYPFSSLDYNLDLWEGRPLFC